MRIVLHRDRTSVGGPAWGIGSGMGNSTIFRCFRLTARNPSTAAVHATDLLRHRLPDGAGELWPERRRPTRRSLGICERLAVADPTKRRLEAGLRGKPLVYCEPLAWARAPLRSR